MKTPMTLSRFRELAHAYGSDLERWPEAERHAARALAESSEPARAALEGERSLDAVFASFVAPRLSDTLAARLQRLPDATVAQPFRIPRRAWRAPAIGWAAAALFGLWLGTQSADAEEASTMVTVDAIDSEPSGVDGSDSRVAELASGAIEDWEDLE